MFYVVVGLLLSSACQSGGYIVSLEGRYFRCSIHVHID